VPQHLRQFVVEQDYDRYDAIDQAVWRFVLLQMHRRLAATAHPAYRNGLGEAGISVDRIPRISEMNDKLGRFGWSAVCVDGFVEPRAFQEFQAHGILPIAAGIRTREHLVYTPAPDIIHEAAGHAPILPDAAFSAYLRRIGDIGKKAFALPEDRRVYRAVFNLSEVKESPTASSIDIASAEAELSAALEASAGASEAARLSRLYWWTAEYGLVGRIDDYKLYGAGLLSSLGESHSCHDPAVVKLPLDERCLDVAFDITRPQPQLFVASSFDRLHDVLASVERTLSFKRGGETALAHALASRELASVQFSSGLWTMGVLANMGPPSGPPAWIAFDGPVAVAGDAKILSDEGARAAPRPDCIVLGPLSDGSFLEDASDQAIARMHDATTARHTFRFARGVRVAGHLEQTVRRMDGRLGFVRLSQARLELPGAPDRELPEFALVAAGDAMTAHAGAADETYHAGTRPPGKRVPKVRELPPREFALRALYEVSERAYRGPPGMIPVIFGAVHAALARDYPNEWLLRWNLLESLKKAGAKTPLCDALRAELDEIGARFDDPQVP